MVIGGKNYAIGIEVYDNKGKGVTRRQCGKLVVANPVNRPLLLLVSFLLGLLVFSFFALLPRSQSTPKCGFTSVFHRGIGIGVWGFSVPVSRVFPGELRHSSRGAGRGAVCPVACALHHSYVHLQSRRRAQVPSQHLLESPHHCHAGVRGKNGEPRDFFLCCFFFIPEACHSAALAVAVFITARFNRDCSESRLAKRFEFTSGLRSHEKKNL